MTSPAGDRPGVPTGNVYAKYQSSHPVERVLVNGFLRRLDRALSDTSPRTVVDVGTGEGEIAERVSRRFPQAKTFGIDLPDPALAREWRQRGVRGLYGDATRLPLPDRCADLVLCLEVLEHVPDPEAVLAEIARVATGHVLLSVPLEPLWRLGNVLRGRYLRDRGNTPGHLNHWTRNGFVRTVAGHLHIQSVHSPLPWTLVVARPR